MRLLLCLALILFGPAAALAGPWPRAPGRFFTALSFSPDPDGGPARRELYAEYGLSQTVTLAVALRRQTFRRAEILARWHPEWQPLGLRLGIGSGIQLTDVPFLRHRLLLEAYLGRGFETGLGNLWLRADLRVNATLIDPLLADWLQVSQTWIETDLGAQIGLRRGDWLVMAGLGRYSTPNGYQHKLSFALGYRLSQRFTLVAEALRGEIRLYDWYRQDPATDRLTLSLWAEF